MFALNVECSLHACSWKRRWPRERPEVSFESWPFLWFSCSLGQRWVQRTLTEFCLPDEEEVTGLWTPPRTSTLRHHTWKACPLLYQRQDTRFCGEKMVDQDPSKSIRSSRGTSEWSQRMHQGTGGHVEALGTCGCVLARLCRFPQGPSNAELACRRQLPLLPGIKAT